MTICFSGIGIVALMAISSLLAGFVDIAEGCNMATKEVGVCLHVYLERDFLSMERIVYPKKNALRREIYSYYQARLQQAPLPLPELNVSPNATEVKGRHRHRLQREGDIWRRVKREITGSSAPQNYAVIDAYGQHGWVEGPELEDYCSRLGGVITCFEEVLIGCETAYDFFRYRHLLHSLERVHRYLCSTPNDRMRRFLPFLKVIDCAESARLQERSCHRPNVTINVWNQILRLEVGPELCDSLNTQRSCLLENGYVRSKCEDDDKEELYRNVSAVFLATWCRLPIHPHLLPYVGPSSSSSSFSSHGISTLATVIGLIFFFLQSCRT